MRIKKLELKNFRGFEELTIDFPEGESGLAVFVGVNGAGKTSILSAISNLLLNFTKDVLNENLVYAVGEMLQLKDIRIGTHSSEGCAIGCQCEILDGIKINLENNTSIGGGSNVFATSFHNSLREQSIKVREKFNRANWIPTPIISYYPASRFVKDNPSLKAKNISNLKPFHIWNDAFENSVEFNEFFEWFRNMEDYENEQIRFTENAKFRTRELDAVRVAIPKFLEGYSNFRVQRQPREAFSVEKNGAQLLVSYLSDGERMVLALVGDIVRRLCIGNPQSSPDDILKGKGIVLIDEIEQHLHPKWQREIVKKLTDTFPNIQFILTTHSPQVLSNVPRENVFILDNFKLEKNKPHTEWRDANALLEDIFDVPKRPEKAEEEISLLYDLIQKKDKAKAEKKFNELKKKLGDRDLELHRAETYMELLMNGK